MASCANDTTTAQREIEITSISWIYSNIDTTYWDTFTDATLFVDFDIKYSGSNITYEDIESAKFSIPAGNTWTYTIDADFVDSDNNLRYSTNPDGAVMPVGPITFEVKLTNGHTATFTQDFPIPGSLLSSGNSYLYTTEDYNGTITADYSRMLKRATNISGTKGANIDINFSINDSNAFSGYIWFYDVSGNYVGVTADYFVDFSTGNADIIINSGAGFNNNGTTNNVILDLADIALATGKTFADITHFHLIVTDGNQYVGTSYTYDIKSTSAKIAFQ